MNMIRWMGLREVRTHLRAYVRTYVRTCGGKGWRRWWNSGRVRTYVCGCEHSTAEPSNSGTFQLRTLRTAEPSNCRTFQLRNLPTAEPSICDAFQGPRTDVRTVSWPFTEQCVASSSAFVSAPSAACAAHGCRAGVSGIWLSANLSGIWLSANLPTLAAGLASEAYFVRTADDGIWTQIVESRRRTTRVGADAAARRLVATAGLIPTTG